MTASINSNPELLIQVVEGTGKGIRYLNDNKFKDELKYWSSSDETRLNVLQLLKETDPKVYAVHINKREIRPGTTSKYTYATQTRNLMEEVMKDSVLKNRTVVVIFDQQIILRRGRHAIS